MCERGIQVVITTNNSSNYIKSCFDSIENSLKNEKWILILSDDDSKDDTFEKVLNLSGSFVKKVVKNKKAKNVAQAKNRALQLTHEFKEEYPYIMMMDIDDKMLPERVKLLDFLIEKKEKFAVGNFYVTDSHKVREVYVNMLTMPKFGAWATVFHQSLIKNDENFFDENFELYEDIAKWWEIKLKQTEFKINYIDCGFVHNYIKRIDSVTSLKNKSHIEHLKGYIEKLENENGNRYKNLVSDVAVIIPYYNFSKNKFCLKNLKSVVEFWKKTGVNVYVSECSNTDYEVDFDDINILKFKGSDFLWQKESIINKTVSILPDNINYIIWADGDIIWKSHDWIREVKKKLDIYGAVQLFRCVKYLDEPQKNILHTSKCYNSDNFSYAPGGAIAVKREFFEFIGLYDLNLTGGGDAVFWMGVTGKMRSDWKDIFNSEFIDKTERWIKKSYSFFRNQHTHLDIDCYHLWHGPRENRQYRSRHYILKNASVKDFIKNDHGLYELSSSNLEFETKMRDYFNTRT
jgi:hypothetical protein